MKPKIFLTGQDNAKYFHNAEDAVTYAQTIFDTNRAFIKESWHGFVAKSRWNKKVSGYYPYFAITVDWKHLGRHPKRLSHGFVNFPGRHVATITRPTFFRNYYTAQLSLLLKHHKVPIEVGVSKCPIPVDYAFSNGRPDEAKLSRSKAKQIKCYFDLPNPKNEDDNANAPHILAFADGDYSLSLFSAARVDSSLRRLYHYTGTRPEDFQRNLAFTNFDQYVRRFHDLGVELMSPTDDPDKREYRRQYVRFVGPGGCSISNANLYDNCRISQSNCEGLQMPAHHLIRDDGNGITLVKLGVGATNTKNITDHLAVLRPNVGLMVGHCAGLSPELERGDYILAQAFLRMDKILDEEVPTYIPIVGLSEVQRAIETAARQITGRNRRTIKDIMRTGTVITEIDRNWEYSNYDETLQLINRSRAIGKELEAGTIAANFFRFCIPSGAFLLNSDMPLFGEPKQAESANRFFKEQVARHWDISMMALEILRDDPNLHSRKLKPLIGRAFL